MSVCALSLGAKEVRYLEVIRKYDKPEVYELAEVFAALVMEMDNDGMGLKDCFGDFFMEYLSHGLNGQFFTPEPICDMMAKICGDIKDGSNVYDCACGSGRMLLASAKINRYAYFFGADIDRNCCLMCVVNLCLNGLLGEVAWMNSITNEFFGAWRIELHEEFHVPYIREITVDECYQYLHVKDSRKIEITKPLLELNKAFDITPINRDAVQGSLF